MASEISLRDVTYLHIYIICIWREYCVYTVHIQFIYSSYTVTYVYLYIYIYMCVYIYFAVKYMLTYFPSLPRRVLSGKDYLPNYMYLHDYIM